MATLMDFLLSPRFFIAFAVFVFIYFFSLAFYRLYWGPLAKFPGPKLAALTYWVEFYYDVVKRGQYTFKIAELHEKYGPIVRVTPNELHVNDAYFWDEVYPGSQKPMDKTPESIAVFGPSLSAIATIPHDLHRMRRSVLNPFFSKRSITEQSGIIESAVEKLCQRIEEFRTSQAPLDLRTIYSALTADVISKYSYGWSYDCLSKPDFDKQMFIEMSSSGELGLLLKHFPWIATAGNMMPLRLVEWLNPQIMALVNRRIEIEQNVKTILEDKSSKEEPKSHTIFHKLIYGDTLPPSERSLPRLIDEGFVLIGAGTITSAHALATISYHVLANPPVLHTLQTELHAAIPDLSHLPPPASLERLSYLTAIIKEGLRLAHAISHRNARVAKDRSLRFDNGNDTWVIPPGTGVSMTSSMLHMNPTFFPEPEEFRPERWLQQSPTGAVKEEEGRQDTATGGAGREEKKTDLDRFLIPFGRGSRICLGMNLAYAELYLTLAVVFRRFELRLFETGREDVDIAHDFLAAGVKLDSKGVRVIVVGGR